MSTLTLYCQAMGNLRTVLDHLTKLRDEGFEADENKRQSIVEQIDTLQEIFSMAMKAVCVSLCLGQPNVLPDHVLVFRKSVSQCWKGITLRSLAWRKSG